MQTDASRKWHKDNTQEAYMSETPSLVAVCTGSSLGAGWGASVIEFLPILAAEPNAVSRTAVNGDSRREMSRSTDSTD